MKPKELIIGQRSALALQAIIKDKSNLTKEGVYIMAGIGIGLAAIFGVVRTIAEFAAIILIILACVKYLKS